MASNAENVSIWWRHHVMQIQMPSADWWPFCSWPNVSQLLWKIPLQNVNHCSPGKWKKGLIICRWWTVKMYQMIGMQRARQMSSSYRIIYRTGKCTLACSWAITFHEADWRIYSEYIRPSLIQTMACRLFSTKSLSEPTLANWTFGNKCL